MPEASAYTPPSREPAEIAARLKAYIAAFPLCSGMSLRSPCACTVVCVEAITSNAKAQVRQPWLA